MPPADAADSAALASISIEGSLRASPRASDISIAVAQILPSAGPAPAHAHTGLAKLGAIARLASARGADVVVFPEYFLAGATHDAWKAVREMGGPTPAPDEEEEDPDEEHWLSRVCAIAKDADIDIVAGTVVELGVHAGGGGAAATSSSSASSAPAASGSTASSAGKRPLYNTSYYVSRLGSVAGRYTKRNLWHPERATLTAAADETHPHERTFAITTKRGRQLKAGMLICWDLAWPQVFRQMLGPSDEPGAESLDGPDIIFIPTCWYATDCGAEGLRWNKHGEAALLDALVQTRAIENEAVIVMCNIAGRDWPDSDGESGGSGSGPRGVANPEAAAQGEPVGVGRSAVAAPFLGAVGRVEHPRETLLLATVDLDVLDDARRVYKMRHDLLEFERQERI